MSPERGERVRIGVAVLILSMTATADAAVLQEVRAQSLTQPSIPEELTLTLKKNGKWSSSEPTWVAAQNRLPQALSALAQRYAGPTPSDDAVIIVRADGSISSSTWSEIKTQESIARPLLGAHGSFSGSVEVHSNGTVIVSPSSLMSHPTFAKAIADLKAYAAQYQATGPVVVVGQMSVAPGKGVRWRYANDGVGQQLSASNPFRYEQIDRCLAAHWQFPAENELVCGTNLLLATKPESSEDLQ
jgi:hypothetical protein